MQGVVVAPYGILARPEPSESYRERCQSRRVCGSRKGSNILGHSGRSNDRRASSRGRVTLAERYHCVVCHGGDLAGKVIRQHLRTQIAPEIGSHHRPRQFTAEPSSLYEWGSESESAESCDLANVLGGKLGVRQLRYFCAAATVPRNPTIAPSNGNEVFAGNCARRALPSGCPAYESGKAISHVSPWPRQSKRISPLSWPIIFSIMRVPNPRCVAGVAVGPPASIQRKLSLPSAEGTMPPG